MKRKQIFDVARNLGLPKPYNRGSNAYWVKKIAKAIEVQLRDPNDEYEGQQNYLHMMDLLKGNSLRSTFNNMLMDVIVHEPIKKYKLEQSARRSLARSAKRIEREKPKYKLSLISESNSIKNIISKHTYDLKINNDLNKITIQEVFDTIDNMIKDFIKNNKLNPTDKIQISLIVPNLKNRSINSFLMLVKDINLLDFMNRVASTLQSAEEIDMNDIKFVFTVVRMPVGGSFLRVLNEDDIYKKKCVIQIMNDDNLCCARAIVVAKAYFDRHEKYEDIRKGRKIQKELAQQLHMNAGVAEDVCGLDEIEKFSEYLQQQIILVAPGCNIIYKTKTECERQIYLLKKINNNHYDAITSMAPFSEHKFWCSMCLKGYNRKDAHHCTRILKCGMCGATRDKCEGNTAKQCKWVKCDDCDRSYPSQVCHDFHKENNMCGIKWKCLDCNKSFLSNAKLSSKLINIITMNNPNISLEELAKLLKHKNNSKETHKCKYDHCHNCGQYDDYNNHQCYIQKEYPKQRNDNIIYFDFEAQQESGTHIVNLACASYSNKDNHYTNGQLSANCVEYNGTLTEKFDNINTFCKWLISERHIKENFTAVAHNGKGYDFQFILKYCVDVGLTPFTIYQGANIMCMAITCGRYRLRLIDSLNFLMMPLKSFPKTFGLTELKKGYFPHYFNKKIHENYVGAMPSKKHYGYDHMSSADRKDFLVWYDKQVSDNIQFDMKRDILEYCISDVQILMQGCEKLRNLFWDNEKVDPFNHTTIASTCMKIFRQNYMKKDSIAIINEIHSPQIHSKVSMEWLHWLSASENINIEHALNGCEKQIEYWFWVNDEKGSEESFVTGKKGYTTRGYYKVDGFCHATNTVYEFHGCYWHGCPKCYKNKLKTMNTDRNKSMEQLYLETEKRTHKITKQGYKVVEMWECEWKALKDKNKNIREFLLMNEINMVEQLNPRDAMFGGRVNASKLKWEASPESPQAHYVDITSLYPTVNYYDQYPSGHHKVIYPSLKDVEERKFFGLIKCKVIPPRKLYHPLLPVKMNNKLMFPLCWTCAAHGSSESSTTLATTKCEHNDEKRAIVGTWTTLELYKALDIGYSLESVYEVWHWEQYSRDIFKKYVSRFLKMKQEASGWPDGVETDEQKQDYISYYKEHQGITLEYDNVEKNAGLRAMSKLCLNSLWGKFGQSPDKSQSKFVSSPEDLYKIVQNDKIDEININIINEVITEISYTEKHDHIKTQYNSNIAIALFTTSNARLRLYSALEKLDKQVIYYDTDSVVYAAGKESIPTGCLLGEWTDELEECKDKNGVIPKIVKWTSGGPKNYAYKLDNGVTKCKIKGFTLNYTNSQSLNMDTMEAVIDKALMLSPTRHNNQIVNHAGQQGYVTVWNDCKITRDKKNKQINSLYQEKVYGFTYNKRQVVLQNGIVDTIPWGF